MKVLELVCNFLECLSYRCPHVLGNSHSCGVSSWVHLRCQSTHVHSCAIRVNSALRPFDIAIRHSRNGASLSHLALCCHDIVFRFAHFRLSPLHGLRIGEASNPGPFQSITFCVTNPTAIFGKVAVVCKLNAQVIFLSETSATRNTQMLEGPNFQKAGFTAFWGAPVAIQKETRTGEGFRGRAVGVALATSMPARVPRSPNSDFLRTNRFLETWVQIGNQCVLCITLYGFHHSHENIPAEQTEERNKLLLNAALASAAQTSGSVIIGGDLNQMLTSQPNNNLAMSRGFVNLIEVARHRWPERTPPTCTQGGGGTFHDTLLAKGPILEYLDKAWVDPELCFHVHSPFFVSFKVPTSTISYRRWKLPRDWTELKPDQPAVHAHYQANRPDFTDLTTTGALEQWASAIEDSVEAALSSTSVGTLPPRYKGRCQPAVFTCAQKAGAPKLANSAHHEPEQDVLTFTAVHKVRQVRRIQTFIRTFAASRREPGGHKYSSQLHAEWKAITRAKGYQGFRGTFRQWCMDHLQSWPQSVSDISEEWLQVMLAEAIADSSAYHQMMSADRLKDFKDTLKQDWKEHGGSLTCKLLKPPTHPPIDQVVHPEETQATLLRARAKGEHRLRLDREFPIIPGDQIRVAGHQCSITLVEGRDISVNSLPDNVPVRTEVEINVWHSSGDDVLRSLLRVWEPYWNRDAIQEQWDLQPWQPAREIIDKFGPRLEDLHLRPLSLESWKHAIRQTRIASAKGACGFNRAELYMLPDEAHIDLLQILERVHAGEAWPSVLTTARTVFLRKCAHDVRAQATRPITIFAMLYRLWAKSWTLVTLSQMTRAVPATLAGGLPTTNTTTLWWIIQAKLEQMQFEGNEAFGFNLDLLKCFNLMGRATVVLLMAKLGVPFSITHAWLRAMMQSTRVLQLRHQCSMPQPSTTGVPEGDPVGVVAIALLGATWINYLQDRCEGLTAFSYADNFEFVATKFRSAVQGVEFSGKFADAFRQKISVGKSWAYATTARGRSRWQAHRDQLAPQERFAVVCTAEDLGATMHYSTNRSASLQKKRFTEVHRRMGHAKKLGLPKEHLHQLVQFMFPAAIHACEIMIPSEERIDKLRVTVSELLLPSARGSNAWLVCAFATKTNLDPLMAVAKQILNTLRRFVHSHRDIVRQVWDLAIILQLPQHKRARHFATGPAASLARLCEHLGWKLEGDLCSQTQTGIKLRMDMVSKNDIADILHLTWNNLLTAQIATKKRWEDVVHDIDWQTTQLCLQRVLPHERSFVLQHITGAQTSDRMKAHFLTEEQRKCDLCGNARDDWHVVTACPAIETTRAQWVDFQRDLLVEYRYTLIMPVAGARQEIENLREFRDRERVDLLTPRLPDAVLTGHTFFTDGSCQALLRDIECVAGWAVVAAKEPALWPTTEGSKRDFFRANQVAAITQGTVPRKQTNNRAELFAIALIIAQSDEATIVTDSAYAMDVASAVLANPDVVAHSGRDNLDIVFPLVQACLSKQSANFVLQKIKSHQVEPSRDDTRSLFRYFGNQLADELAKAATTLAEEHTNHLVRQCRTISAATRERTVRAMKCLASLHQASVTARNDAKVKAAAFPAEDGRGPVDELLSPTYVRLREWQLPDLTFAAQSRMFWGVTYTLRLHAWVLTLQWPDPSCDSVGDISWYELFVNFRIVTQSFVPINTGTDKAHPRWELPEHRPSLAITPQPACLVLRNFTCSLAYLAQLLETRVFPAEPKIQVETLPSALKGQAAQLSGLDRRPVMKAARQTAAILRHHTPSVNRRMLGALPDIPKLPPEVWVPLQDGDLPELCAKKKNVHKRWMRS